MDQLNPIVVAHKHSSNHRKEILSSEVCGCFYCLEIYPPSEIQDWVDDNQCALCAKCGIDSVISSASNYQINKEFLNAMNEYWFQRTVSFQTNRK